MFSCFSEKNLEKVSFPMMDFADLVSISISKWMLSTYVVAVQGAMPLWPLFLFWKIPSASSF